MAEKGYKLEQIINELREAEILLSQGEMGANVSKFRSSRDLLSKILTRIRV
jgi:hypothetical protein